MNINLFRSWKRLGVVVRKTIGLSAYRILIRRIDGKWTPAASPPRVASWHRRERSADRVEYLFTT
jgi:hypothetical protein